MEQLVMFIMPGKGADWPRMQFKIALRWQHGYILAKIVSGVMTMKILFMLGAFMLIGISMANAHGGGCRKSSPAGMCCHMDNSTGSVHCH
jgi:hypothetical protein